MSSYPGWLRRLGAGGLRLLPPGAWDGIAGMLRPILPAALREKQVGGKVHKLAGVIGTPSPEALYHDLVSHWTQPTEIVTSGQEPPTVLTDPERWARLPDFAQRMMFLDLVSYLPDDILTKVDRASMAVSLEARVPMLDHRVVEFAWRLPLEYKIKGNSGKHILRQVLYRHVPKALVERPKMGFGVPIDSWLRGPLRAWAEDLLDANLLQRQGYLRADPIREKWLEHQSGRRNWQYLLWDVLMFQAWLQ
jgi:asparagine synthase (glutamine-hydrolysing)